MIILTLANLSPPAEAMSDDEIHSRYFSPNLIVLELTLQEVVLFVA